MKSIKVVVSFVLTFSINISIFSQNERNTRFEIINLEDGLSQLCVNCIMQDNQGYMWFGTYNGLSRFDGYQFVNFRNDPSDPASISNNIVFHE